MRVRLSTAAALAAALSVHSGCASKRQPPAYSPPPPELVTINPDGLAKSPRYSHVVSVRGGRLVFVSGQIAMNAAGELVGAGDMRAQTEQVFRNLGIALAAAGASLRDVVRLNSYVVDLEKNLDAFRQARSQFATTPPPASTLVGVTGLALPGALVEVEAVAFVAK